MTPEQITEHIRQQLAEKDRSDLDRLGRAQTFRAILENAKENGVAASAKHSAESRP